MWLLDLVTTAGGAGLNEDRAGRSGALAWVIDGATDLYDDAALPAASDTQWLVDRVDTLLHAAGEAGETCPAVALLEWIAADIGRGLAASSFPDGRVPPACSIAVMVDYGPGFEIVRVGDATAVVTGERAVVLATDFFDRRESGARALQRAGEAPARTHAAMCERRLYTMVAGDVESVFSGHPARQLRPHTTAGDWESVEHVLLCTDGFARAVTDYSLYQSWTELVADAKSNGLAHLEKAIRDVEQNPAVGRARFKRSDDLASVLLAP